MIESLALPAALRAQLLEEARVAAPRECCGLIEGVREGGTVRAVALHASRNLAAAPDRFAIDPALHLGLSRQLRGSGRAVVGCYHSHPNGRAEPSAQDRDGAGEEDFVWLIAGQGAGAPALHAFSFENGQFRQIALSALADPAAPPL